MVSIWQGAMQVFVVGFPPLLQSLLFWVFAALVVHVCQQLVEHTAYSVDPSSRRISASHASLCIGSIVWALDVVGLFLYNELSHHVLELVPTRTSLRSKVASKILSKPFVLEEMLLNFVVLKNRRQDAEEPLVYLVTNLQESARTIADRYGMRWKIEAFFKHMKTNGFSLENMNLGTEARCRLLMAIVVFSYVISIKEGLKAYRKVRAKLYSDGTEEMEESVFRCGINSLMRFCANLQNFCRHIFGKIGNDGIPEPILILKNV